MKKLLIIITLSLLALDAFAQRKVSGYVYGRADNERLIGARIQEVSTENFTITDFYGRFEFTTTKDTTELRISYVEIFPETIKITTDTTTLLSH